MAVVLPDGRSRTGAELLQNDRQIGHLDEDSGLYGRKIPLATFIGAADTILSDSYRGYSVPSQLTHGF
jgi:hypothetical protein